MKLVWSPETASKAYLDTIQICRISTKSSVAEFLSAMAAGYNAKLIVEAWKSDNKINGESIATSIGLAIVSKHNRGRYVCVVPDKYSRLEYVGAMQNSGVSLPEVMVGEAEEVMKRQNGVDFFVVDERRCDFTSLFNSSKLSNCTGAILVCKNGSKIRNIENKKFSWDGVLNGKVCVVRSVTLPLGNGLDIAYIASKDGNQKVRKYAKRWIRHIGRNSGEEHVIRR